RPDKSGNSRFEYTKILNTAHAGTLAGLAALRTKRSHMCQFISHPKKPTGRYQNYFNKQKKSQKNIVKKNYKFIIKLVY
ncbi:MAG TPA: hypothetical protein PK899_04275, partial [Spirochaetota bacterium]|nr:hypothetical protein [Spirochaetota bacterium]